MIEVDPIEVRVREAAMLREVGEAARAVDEAKAELRRRVEAAHAIGLSWAAIGGVLGMTRQGTREKYAKAE